VDSLEGGYEYIVIFRGKRPLGKPREIRENDSWSVAWEVDTNISEEQNASIFRVEVPTLKMEAVVCSKPLVLIYQRKQNHDPP
jgi:hypothetical protein